MALKLYNTLTKNLDTFVPIDPAGKKVGLYTCGPTVYNYAHIGNFRAYIFADIVRRTLGYSGFEVNHIMNLTDVDDKTIRDSQATGKSLNEFTTFFADEFKKDAASLNIVPPTVYTRAVEHINDMVALIEQLLEKGFAYKSDDGSVYFNIEKDDSYGQLSPVAISSKVDNAAGRIKLDEYEKDNASDFALWKSWDEADGDVFWETSLGKGRPGWHIECSAMSMKYLGNHFDIHTGGIDLVFPHHENEIAQSECATGEKFVNYWLHNEWVMVEGKKMSKSAGNFVTLRGIIEKGIDPLAFRLLVLMSHHRSPLNFTWQALEGATNAFARVRSFMLSTEEGGTTDQKYQEEFMKAVQQDFDTPKAVSLMFEVLGDGNLSADNKKATILNFDEVLGFGFANMKAEPIPEEMLALANEREQARKDKNFARSDELRDEIEAAGYTVKDTPEGPVIIKQ